MEVKFKGLGKNEKYACDIRDIKKMFHNEEIFISFGYLTKTFRFDFAWKKNRPTIHGQIVCSMSYNMRLNLPISEKCYLCFYVIRDDAYSEKYQQDFVDTVLPQIRNWLNALAAKQNGAIPGVEELLVEWTGQGFTLYPCRFH